VDDPYSPPSNCGGTVLQRSKAISTASVCISGYNAHRVRIQPSPTNTNRIWLAFGQAAVVGQGIAIYPGEQPWPMSRDNIGDAIRHDIFAISEGTGETLVWFEEVG
jgi:hypothetical protein